jgi:hypothetical protein
VIGFVRFVVFALGSAALLIAAKPPPTPSRSTPEQNQFDLVVGNWPVRDSSGHVTGTTTFSKEYGGCVLIERWRGVGPAGEGLGVIGYRPASRTWHRDFIDHSRVVEGFTDPWVMRARQSSTRGENSRLPVTSDRYRFGWNRSLQVGLRPT